MTLVKGNQNNEDSKSNNDFTKDELFKIVTTLNKKVEDLERQQVENQFSSQGISPSVSSGISADDLTKILAAIKEPALSDVDFDGGIKVEDIPQDDYLDKPVRFCAPYVGHVITGDLRKGYNIKLPYNRPYIFFEYQGYKKIQQGKYEALAVYSTYESHSKKEVAWLRDHSRYGINFYETSTEALSADVLKMQRLSRVMTVLQNYDLIDLIKRCKEYGIQPTEDPRVMRTYLAYEMVKRESESEKSISQKTLEDTLKERDKLIV